MGEFTRHSSLLETTKEEPDQGASLAATQICNKLAQEILKSVPWCDLFSSLSKEGFGALLITLNKNQGLQFTTLNSWDLKEQKTQETITDLDQIQTTME